MLPAAILSEEASCGRRLLDPTFCVLSAVCQTTPYSNRRIRDLLHSNATVTLARYHSPFAAEFSADVAVWCSSARSGAYRSQQFQPQISWQTLLLKIVR